MVTPTRGPGVECGDGQADAVDRDRAFVHQIAIEACGTRTFSHQLPSPNSSSAISSPVASTCPCTMWPDSRVAGVTGRSRFTREPGVKIAEVAARESFRRQVGGERIRRERRPP